MSYLDKFPKSCDFMREELELSKEANLYELVTKFVEKYKELKLKSQKEKKHVGRPKKSS